MSQDKLGYVSRPLYEVSAPKGWFFLQFVASSTHFIRSNFRLTISRNIFYIRNCSNKTNKHRINGDNIISRYNELIFPDWRSHCSALQPPTGIRSTMNNIISKHDTDIVPTRYLIICTFLLSLWVTS